ncbi:ferric reductase-like transmembrane domain-containing protein [Thauera sp.]|uniref:ferredoxin reductase family protein n=1 Tax=Thauera sp. TaxID=1905334 RepID=UPI002BC6CCF7|nr:ferric reductase-like transmembrane domain-containing protein [Thauera sp.]HRP25554.1 ferric reductase-like transmembrane domain-containing protein [Thauera sp.]
MTASHAAQSAWVRWRRARGAVVWVAAYLLLVCAPLLLLLSGRVPPGAGLWWDLSMAFGFAGLAVMGVQFALTARLRRATAPFGIDIIYYFHRLAALVGIGLILAHWLIVRVAHGEALGSLDPLEAPGHMSAGRLALVFFLVLIGTSLWRKRLGLEYRRWRMLHTVVATAAMLLAVIHVLGVGYYTGEGWKRWLWIGYTLSWVLLIVHVRVVKPWRMRQRPYRVVEVRAEGGGTTTLTVTPDGHAGLRFAPGQFAWLTARASPFSFEEHPFSFSGSAEQPGRLAFSIKALGDFTRTVATMEPGETVYLDGPYGVFSTERYPQARGFVFVAAGVGIAPIMSMLRTLADRGDRRPLLLIDANRDLGSVIFRDELETLRARLALRIVHVLEDPPVDWPGERGRIDAALLRRVLPAALEGHEYFVCGPRVVSEIVQRELHALGVGLGHLHFELFDMV